MLYYTKCKGQYIGEKSHRSLDQAAMKHTDADRAPPFHSGRKNGKVRSEQLFQGDRCGGRMR